MHMLHMIRGERSLTFSEVGPNFYNGFVQIVQLDGSINTVNKDSVREIVLDYREVTDEEFAILLKSMITITKAKKEEEFKWVMDSIAKYNAEHPNLN